MWNKFVYESYLGSDPDPIFSGFGSGWIGGISKD